MRSVAVIGPTGRNSLALGELRPRGGFPGTGFIVTLIFASLSWGCGDKSTCEECFKDFIKYKSIYVSRQSDPRLDAKFKGVTEMYVYSNVSFNERDFVTRACKLLNAEVAGAKRTPDFQRYSLQSQGCRAEISIDYKHHKYSLVNLENCQIVQNNSEEIGSWSLKLLKQVTDDAFIEDNIAYHRRRDSVMRDGQGFKAQLDGFRVWNKNGGVMFNIKDDHYTVSEINLKGRKWGKDRKVRIIDLDTAIRRLKNNEALFNYGICDEFGCTDETTVQFDGVQLGYVECYQGMQSKLLPFYIFMRDETRYAFVNAVDERGIKEAGGQ